MTEEPDPEYYGALTYHALRFELWRARWKNKRTTYTRWYAKTEGQTAEQFHVTRADTPASAIGHAILLSPECEELANRLYGPA